MKLLLDTHIALWAITDDARLKSVARTLITDAENAIYISAASVWEIAIKHRLQRSGPNAMPVSAPEALTYFRSAGYLLLPITPQHAAGVGALPDHHKDPFDRMLIAQALAEPLRLLTHDARLKTYSDTIIEA